jgi:hypothetical protein
MPLKHVASQLGSSAESSNRCAAASGYSISGGGRGWLLWAAKGR